MPAFTSHSFFLVKDFLWKLFNFFFFPVSFGDLVLTSVGYDVWKDDEYVSRKKELEGRLCSLF